MTGCSEIRTVPLFVEKLWHVLMQNGQCVICGEPIFMDRPTHTYGAFSFEHKVPRNHGGSNRRTNIAASHNECNKARGNRATLKLVRPPTEFVGPKPLTPRRIVWYAPNVWLSCFHVLPEDLP
jgi:hypothetical protein